MQSSIAIFSPSAV